MIVIRKGDSSAWRDYIDATNLKDCYVIYDVTVRGLNANEYCKVCILLRSCIQLKYIHMYIEIYICTYIPYNRFRAVIAKPKE